MDHRLLSQRDDGRQLDFHAVIRFPYQIDAATKDRVPADLQGETLPLWACTDMVGGPDSPIPDLRSSTQIRCHVAVAAFAGLRSTFLVSVYEVRPPCVENAGQADWSAWTKRGQLGQLDVKHTLRSSIHTDNRWPILCTS